MNNVSFEELLKDRLSKIQQTLVNKAREYASTDDRLHNFKESAAFLRCSPPEACIAFMTKHLVSVMDIVVQVRSGEKVPGSLIDEKIGDAINYLILLEACLKELPPMNQ